MRPSLVNSLLLVLGVSMAVTHVAPPMLEQAAHGLGWVLLAIFATRVTR